MIQWGGGGRRLTLVGTILLGLAKLPHVLLSKRRILGLNGSVGVRGRSGISLDAPNMSGTKKTGPYKSTVKMVIFFWHLAPDFSFSINLHHFCPALCCPVAQLSFVAVMLFCCSADRFLCSCVALLPCSSAFLLKENLFSSRKF